MAKHGNGFDFGISGTPPACFGGLIKRLAIVQSASRTIVFPEDFRVV